MDGEDLRLAVYRAFAETGRAPGAGELAGQFGVSARVVGDSLEELARARHLALGDHGQIVMAHPFSAMPLGFSVMGARILWWGHSGAYRRSGASTKSGVTETGSLI